MYNPSPNFNKELRLTLPPPSVAEMWKVVDDNGDRGLFPVVSEFLDEPMARVVMKPWGHELIVAETPEYTGKLEHIKAGCRLSMQYHAQSPGHGPSGGKPAKDETMCLISGRAVLWIGVSPEDLRSIEMKPFVGYRIKPPTVHRLEAITDCVIAEFSTPETGRTVRLHDDYPRSQVETEAMRADPNRGWNG